MTNVIALCGGKIPNEEGVVVPLGLGQKRQQFFRVSLIKNPILTPK